MSDVSAKEMSALISEILGRDIDPKAFRRFVREYRRARGMGDALPGRGGAYVFDADDAERIADAYRAHRARGGVVRVTFEGEGEGDA
jgi:hypothetical protein